MRRRLVFVGVAAAASVLAALAASRLRTPATKVEAPPPLANLGWYLAPREGEELRVTYSTADAPERDLRTLVPAARAAREILAWARDGSSDHVAFVNRAVLGNREGLPDHLHVGYADATGRPLRTRGWETRELPRTVRQLVEEVDRAAERAARDQLEIGQIHEFR